MTQPIGIRLPKEMMSKIDRLSKQEMADRSTIIRKLVIAGYYDIMKKKIAEEYVKENLTLSEAAEQAGLTIWEMERYLIENGFKSSYSIEDLEKEIKLLPSSHRIRARALCKGEGERKSLDSFKIRTH